MYHGEKLLRPGARGISIAMLALLLCFILTSTLIIMHWSTLDSALCLLTNLGWTSTTCNNGSRPLALPTSLAQGPGHDRLGAVASESSICSAIGIDLLKAGGNAADAIVGTIFCTGVIGMYHSGIGGGGFMLVRDSSGAYESIDFRETAPAAAFQDMYEHDAQGSVYGGLASGVPGEVKGLAYLHENYGVLPWETVMAGAIKVARDGFPVTEDLERAMGFSVAGKRNFLVEDPVWAQDFAPKGTLLQLGQTITRKRYADTLEAIAKGGPDVFYTGVMAEQMIRSVQEVNGTMTIEDLANYTVAVRLPVEIGYRGYKLKSIGAPASGAIALGVLKTIEGYDTMGQEAWTNLSTHRLDEAMRFGYGQRTNIGDPDFVKGLDEYEADIIKDSTAVQIRSKISDLHTLNVSAYDPSGFEVLDTPGTTHVVAADASGMAISITTTINLFFGSQLMVPESGIIMNNEMDDFSIPGRKNAFGFVPSPSNYIRAGKRPLSSITPVIVEYPNGTLYFVVGAAGGSRIMTATIQNLWNVLDRNMTSPEALATPRMHDQLLPNEVTFEYNFDNSTVQFLKERGHNVTWVGTTGYSAAQALRRMPNGTFEAAGEPRQRNSGGFAI